MYFNFEQNKGISSLEELKKVIHYDPDTGIFTWLILVNINKGNPGDIAGCLRNDYITIGINGKRYYAHHLAWFYMKGEWPKEIDHWDTNKSNNKWKNLRLSNRSQNMYNTKLRKDNKSGYKGVSRFRDKWQTKIWVNKECIYLGIYDTAEEAYKIYCEAAEKYHGEFVNLG
jgi:hypothetical protein